MPITLPSRLIQTPLESTQFPLAGGTLIQRFAGQSFAQFDTSRNAMPSEPTPARIVSTLVSGGVFYGDK